MYAGFRGCFVSVLQPIRSQPQEPRSGIRHQVDVGSYHYLHAVSTTTPTGDLTLAHILNAAGVDLADVVVLRHTYTRGGLETAADLTPANVLHYTRRQELNNKVGKTPPRYWMVFMADGAHRSRLITVYENYGEVPAEQTGTLRFFDLRPTDRLSALVRRLVVEWSKDAVNWATTGVSAAAFPVVEIADPEAVPFPGFDRVLVTHGELRDVIEDSRHAAWRTALGSVQGIFLIADTSNGQLYVGKADGGERILWPLDPVRPRRARWQHRPEGPGRLDPTHARHFLFSILRVFGPSVPTTDVDEAESHYKRALLTREHGLNRN
jgi:hypothetical protein